VRLVDHAQATKLPIQKIVDRISSVFVPGVLGMAGLTFLGWLAGGRSLTGAMANALSVLLIACPCSLGLATPTAIMAGIGQGARRGIFIRNGESLELASRITHLVFDKTGTLTEGKPEVAHIANLSDLDDEAFLTLAAAAEIGSEHHLGRAIVRHARQKGLRLPEAADFLSLPGHGVRAFVEGMPVVAGNLAMLSDEGVDDSPLADSATSMAEAGLTPVLVAIGGKAAGVIGIADRVRPSARLAIEALHRSGVRIMMVTGDVPLAARRIAAQLGIDEIHASATPERKLEIIRERQAAGAVVGMVGDGTNDAPALAAADVGFAIGSGTDVAIEAAHVTLIGGDPVKVAEAIELSRRTMRIIRQNLFWAMGYNIVAIPWAAVGRLTPMLASTAMALSSVSVVTNSLRLQREGPK
jgi:Cu+-exporting ATPase